MSGSVSSIPLQATGINPLPAEQAVEDVYARHAGTGLIGQQTQETAARTGLIGQQATAAAIQNNLALMRLRAIGPYLGSGAAPASDGSGGMAPGGIGADGGAGAPGGGGAGAGGGAAMPQQISAYGAVASPFGVAVPGLMAVSALTAQDPTKAWTEVLQSRARTIGQAIGGAQTPQDWNAAVQSLYGAGWLSPHDYVTHYGHPEHKQAVLNAIQDPSEYAGRLLQAAGMGLEPNATGGYQANPTAIGAHGAMAGAAAGGASAATAPLELVDVPVRNADGTFSTQKMTRQDALNRGLLGSNQPAGNLVNGAHVMPADAWANRSMLSEGGIGTGARPNTMGPGGTPVSSAAGGQQFIDGTWLHLMKTNHPDLTQGKTDAQILSLRSGNNLSNQVAIDYANENAPVLTQAGLPANASTLKMAHALGPDAAVRTLEAPENTPMARILSPEAMAANPQYANMTNSQLIGNTVARFGVGQVAGVGGAPAAPAAAGGGGARPPGVIGEGPPEPTKVQQEQIGADREQVKDDAKALDQIQTGAMHANSAMPILYSVRDVASRIPVGSLGSARADVANFLQTFSPEWANKFVAATTNIDPSKAGAMQEFIKQTFQTVTSAESQLSGARIGARLTEYFSKALPNINMQGDAIKDMTNFLLVGHQMVKDYAQGASQHYNGTPGQPGARDAFLADPIGNRYQPLSKFDQSWLDAKSPHAPQVYESAAMALNRRPFAEWSKGLDKDQRDQVIGVVQRADPSQGGVFNSKGHWIPVTSFPAPAAAGGQ